ncbi:protein phosphatase CheZ [Paraburkholderia sp.]|uniref:protein phosphatase CheZ n=1 Tax=Paraburkholderia sp. TaxID=1926495 RepID=UPI00239534E9|nr:protein phosphatase CheZ [Paraburkholderia sp.]MDE1179008.1 protein phosphatase CheZ [Paraburkholderia sp.]
MSDVKQTSLAKESVEPESTEQSALSAPDENEVLAKVALITRSLYESLQALGLDSEIRATLAAVPDLASRLEYVEKVSEDAATRTLNAVDTARPALDQLGKRSDALTQRWDAVEHDGFTRESLAGLLTDTRRFVRAMPDETGAANAQLTEVLVAQSFQDLTGQVLRKVSELVQSLERQLADLLTDSVTPERRALFAQRVATEFAEIAAPVVVVAAEEDAPAVVTDQAEVDDLLSSLGF